MHYDRPIVLSIGGFDPTGGAGVLADVKTMEQNGCLGMAVLSATTIQTENECLSIQWFSAQEIIDQLTPLMNMYSINVVKIGIIQDLNCLQNILSFIFDQNPEIQVVWDPVLSASSGFVFTDSIQSTVLESILKHITLLTPNAQEIVQLTNETNELTASEKLATYTSVFLKGGHRSEKKGEDILFHSGEKRVFEPSTEPFYDKHGTGCILASAIASQIAGGNSLALACENAKKYVAERSRSNIHKLAYHVA